MIFCPISEAIREPLVKSALLGADPNFGRILQSVGQALGAGAPFVVDLSIEGIQVASAGVVIDLDAETWRTLERAVESPEVEIDLALPGEGGETDVVCKAGRRPTAAAICASIPVCATAAALFYVSDTVGSCTTISTSCSVIGHGVPARGV